MKKTISITAVLILAIFVLLIPAVIQSGETGFSLLPQTKSGSDIWSVLDEKYVQFAENFDPEMVRSVTLHSNNKSNELVDQDDIREIFDMLDELEAYKEETVYDSYVPPQKYFRITFNLKDGSELHVQFRGQNLIGYTSLETIYLIRNNDRLISYINEALPMDFHIWYGELADHGGLLSADLSSSDGWEILEDESDSKNILYVKTSDGYWQKGIRELTPSVYIHFIREFDGYTYEEASDYVHSIAESLKSDYADLTVDELDYCGRNWFRITLSDSSIQLYSFIEGGFFCIECSHVDLSEACVQWIMTSIQFAIE